MPQIHPIPATRYAVPPGGDVSALIAPPYDVLDEGQKNALLGRNPHNIVAIDLPHLPAKTVGPDEAYEAAGDRFRRWIDSGILETNRSQGCFVYRQTFDASGRTHRRLGLIANIRLSPFGSATGQGAIFPHEQTFDEPKEDRLKLMRATRSQLSPIFGLYGDPQGATHDLLDTIAGENPPSLHGTTANDGVLHELWEAGEENGRLAQAVAGMDVFIADGHHRYNTALNYESELQNAGVLHDDHPAHFCTFVLVAIQDPGMIVLPTHRVLGGMTGFSIDGLAETAAGKLVVSPFEDDSAALEAALPGAGPHAMGLVDADGRLGIATTAGADPEDPLAEAFAERSEAWRRLDVAVVQHLVVEQICEPRFCPGRKVQWRFPHTPRQVLDLTDGEHFQLGLVMQPTPLESVRLVSEAGELMPQKSTFFYPKLATGLVINPLE